MPLPRPRCHRHCALCWLLQTPPASLLPGRPPCPRTPWTPQSGAHQLYPQRCPTLSVSVPCRLACEPLPGQEQASCVAPACTNKCPSAHGAPVSSGTLGRWCAGGQGAGSPLLPSLPCLPTRTDGPEALLPTPSPNPPPRQILLHVLPSLLQPPLGGACPLPATSDSHPTSSSSGLCCPPNDSL